MQCVCRFLFSTKVLKFLGVMHMLSLSGFGSSLGIFVAPVRLAIALVFLYRFKVSQFRGG
jgi:hypothetical protein